MKKIMIAMLNKRVSTVAEFDWIESSECEHGHEWDGDVAGYAANLIEDPDEMAIIPESECEYTIHNVPDSAYVLIDLETGRPIALYWAIDDEQ